MKGSARSGLTATLALDVRVQARARLYVIGIVLAVLFGSVARLLAPAQHATLVAVGLFFTGIGGTTFMFGASMVLLEKSQGTLEALRTTPLSTGAYLSSKVLTLSAFSVVECAVIFLVGFSGRGVSPLVPLMILPTAVLYTLVGLALVARCESLSAFVMPAGLIAMVVLQFPFISLLGVGPDWLWYLFPSEGPLLLLQAAAQTSSHTPVEPLSVVQWTYAVGMTLLALTIASVWAARGVRLDLGIGHRAGQATVDVWTKGPVGS